MPKPGFPCWSSRLPGAIADAMKIAELLQSLADAQVDYVLVRPDVTFEKLFASAVKGHLFGRRVLIASIDDLAAMKRVANRPKDRIDIEALERILRGEDPNDRNEATPARLDSGNAPACPSCAGRTNTRVLHRDVAAKSSHGQTGRLTSAGDAVAAWRRPGLCLPGIPLRGPASADFLSGTVK